MKNLLQIRKKALFALVVAVSIGFPFTSLGQGVSKVGTTVGDFLQIGVGPRALGQGGAFVAAANDISALYWNPAGLAEVSGTEIFVTHSEWLANINFDYIGVGLNMGSKGSLGFSLTRLGVPEMLVRTEDRQDGTGEFFDAADMAAAVTYSRKVTDRFAVGGTVKYVSQRIWNSTASAFAIDLGTQFRTDFFGNLTIGAAIFNFGTDMQMSGRDVRTFVDPDPRHLGNNNAVPANYELDSFKLPLNFQFGISSRPIFTRMHQLTINVDALHPSSNNESVNVGMEYGFQSSVFLRTGFQSLFLEEREGGFSAGVGIHQVLFDKSTAKLDYAYRAAGRLGGIHVIGLALSF
ncbi:PorV/PorQ family protein [bacterium]|nr:PorV/PorQ family protein [bacterium]